MTKPYLPQSEFNRILLSQLRKDWYYECADFCIDAGYQFTEDQFDAITNSADNPSYAAHLIALNELVSPEWAMKIIENDNVGDPSWAARWMARDKLATPEWAMEIIKNDKTGTAHSSAYMMVYHHKLAPRSWYDENFRDKK